MRNVVVTGASAPLGRRLLEQLRGREGVERLLGVEPAESSEWLDGVELVSFDGDHRPLVEFLNDHEIDTVFHCAFAPDRNGTGAGAGRHANVIDTMRLGAAIGCKGGPVRSWVVASSSVVYPINSKAPLLNRETVELAAPEGSLAASLLEAEDYVRDVAERNPHLNVSILRLQQLVGRDVGGPMASMLRQSVVPSLIGFDAAIQLLASGDAVRALEFAGELELAGIYNVASTGIVRFSEIVRTLNRRSLPVLPFETGPLGRLARTLGLPAVPDGMVELLRFGHALDTTKLTSAGFSPEYDQAGCLTTLRT